MVAIRAISLDDPTSTIVKYIVNSNKNEKGICAECRTDGRVFLLTAENGRGINLACYNEVCEDCLSVQIDIFRGMSAEWKQIRVL